MSVWPWIDSLISLSLTYLLCEMVTVLSPRIGVGIESESIPVQSNDISYSYYCCCLSSMYLSSRIYNYLVQPFGVMVDSIVVPLSRL